MVKNMERSGVSLSVLSVLRAIVVALILRISITLSSRCVKVFKGLYYDNPLSESILIRNMGALEDAL